MILSNPLKTGKNHNHSNGCGICRKTEKENHRESNRQRSFWGDFSVRFRF